MTMELDNIISELCKREDTSGCYDIEIDGIKVYNLIRFKVRNIFLASRGFNFVEKFHGLNRWHYIKSIFQSAFQLGKILLRHKKIETLFFPFLRLDRVGGVYLDKFTDPIIECCGIEDNYIILERCRRGEHPIPRLHKSNVVYSDLIDVYCELCSHIFYRKFAKKNKEQLNRLFETINFIVEGEDYKQPYLTNRIVYCLHLVKIYELLLEKLGVKKIYGPSRANLFGLIYAARRCGIKVYEFQHGITYGETALYSGYRDTNFTPDYFLAFGDTPPRDVYGIDESKIYNIGWAFQAYLENNMKGESFNNNDVLIISSPCQTAKILSAVALLARQFPKINFVVRPHPVEVITDSHLKLVFGLKNVSFQNPKINVAEVMQVFNNIIGENSTVLYEALNYNKKVARFCFEGFSPRYLTPEDEECFWKVNDGDSFMLFMNAQVGEKKTMKIYSKFDKELFMKLYNS